MKELSDISTSWDVKNGGAVSRTCTDSLRADRVVCPHDWGHCCLISTVGASAASEWGDRRINLAELPIDDSWIMRFTYFMGGIIWPAWVRIVASGWAEPMTHSESPL